ncbi:hypothetical protein GCM10025857_02490 [Alicyclobacillus contaminans]|uniref:hypothetical protein n=1 Tax=Alicyclobacillus contaminans TaxID=392016 RepID=UPI0003F89EC8|nr:hypothetical protein [Alicyclobacillus contaminans]GMA48892.1 hypothetical protein GCM10025857_02490 [Alicyclobacillus contaminans]
MSEKRQVPTFRLHLPEHAQPLEGPVVCPDRTEVATNLTTIHHILKAHDACLVYAGQWVYVPFHAIRKIERGAHRFQLPWPLNP